MFKDKRRQTEGGEFMKKVILAVGVIILGAFFAFAYVLYKIGEDMTYIHRCGCQSRDY